MRSWRSFDVSHGAIEPWSHHSMTRALWSTLEAQLFGAAASATTNVAARTAPGTASAAVRGIRTDRARTVFRTAANPATARVAVAPQNTAHATRDPARPSAERASTHATTHRPVATGAAKKAVARR